MFTRSLCSGRLGAGALHALEGLASSDSSPAKPSSQTVSARHKKKIKETLPIIIAIILISNIDFTDKGFMCEATHLVTHQVQDLFVLGCELQLET